MTTVLVIGYGNPGRKDDGLGPAFAEGIGEAAIPGVTVDANYQLSIEDAVDIASHDIVLFADADMSGPAPYCLRRLEPTPWLGFTSHSISPGALLALAKERFGARCEAWVLGIRGYEFDEYGEGLSQKARENLKVAIAELTSMIRMRAFKESGGEA